MVLAISWQAAFCERAQKRRECRTQSADRFDATHFSLHGLWPQPASNVYCDVDGQIVARDKARKWRSLGDLNLTAEMEQRLIRTMPGSMSGLDRHEWIKHGTCYSADAQTYYRHSLALMDKINSSAIRTLFTQNIGRYVSGDKIRDAFDFAFGKGVGKRVRISCRRDGARSLIVELTLGISGSITDSPDLSALMLASSETSPGCPGGIIDPVGFQ